MLDGRFDLEYYRILAGKEIPDSEQVRDFQDVAVHPIVVRPWMAALVAVILLCIVMLT